MVKRFATAAAVTGIVASIVDAGSESVVAIRTTNPARQRYLAHAIIWHTPPDLSPGDVLKGPLDSFPDIAPQAASDEGLPCAYTKRGEELGGASPKFLCRTIDGRSLQIKYWDPESQSGNREVFAVVA